MCVCNAFFPRRHCVCRRAYKTVEEEDLRFPLVYGEGKKARVLATIGVTRGLGDHDLKVHDSNIYIKPFMSCCPEVPPFDPRNPRRTTSSPDPPRPMTFSPNPVVP